ncbi:MAG: Fic family protein [Oligoflexia bacterium]|nr:Fic family protein [Oligoflexia bacterium]
MDFNERKQKIIAYLKIYGTVSSSEAQALTNAHRNTISSDLKKLIEEKVVNTIGNGKGTKYQLLENLIFSNENITSLFPNKERRKFEQYFKSSNRKKSFFNITAESALNADFTYSQQIEERFLSLKERITEKRRTLSEVERKRRKEKLVIDLSWASSNIEGNTYSILETEALIKFNETAKGKSFKEAQMILNHKAAIDYIREEPEFKKLDKQKVLALHQLLTKNLDVNTGFRDHLVAISNSSFIPCDNKFQIISFFDNILTKINLLKNSLEQALAANLLIAYLQPFSDGNKRTSRMLGNAILLSTGYLPISFSHTPKEDYIKAMLYFYEKQDSAYFKQLFLNELNSSFREYIG